MKSARLLCENISDHLVNKLGFIVNPYDMCVANKVIEGKQCTILWHVDDFKVSHPSETIVYQVIADLEERYGKMAVEHGPEQTFVGMDITFLQNDEVRFCIEGHVIDAIDDFPEEISSSRTSSTSDGVFTVSSTSQVLDADSGKLFHSIFAKILFISRRARPDIQVPIGFLGTRVTCSTQEDWIKLKLVLEYLKNTIETPLTLGMNGTSLVSWWVDASYGVHLDMKSQT